LFTGNGFSDKAFATEAMDQVGEPTLKGQLGLKKRGGDTVSGAFTRIRPTSPTRSPNDCSRWQRCGIWHSWNIGNLAKRSSIAYDH
jgi:hypothetical protein